MLKNGIFRSRVLALVVLTGFVLLLTPVSPFAQAPPKGGGTLTGQVVGTDMKTPIVNATVKIRNLNNQKEYSSPTDKTGMYKITGIEEGWYTLGVSSVLGDYNLNYGVYVKTGEQAKLNLSIKSSGVLEGKGLGSTAHKSFFATPAGIVVIVAVAAGGGFAIYSLTKKEQEVSPVNR